MADNWKDGALPDGWSEGELPQTRATFEGGTENGVPVWKRVKNTISNIPGSAVKFVENAVTPLFHPIDTATALAKTGAGFVEKALPGSILPAGRPNEQYADSLINYAKDRYGSGANLVNTIETDPVGFIGDVSALTGGRVFNPLTMPRSGALKAATILPEVTEESMYVRGMKPFSGLARSMSPEKVKQLANTGLNEGVTLTKGGLERSQNIIGDINAEVQSRINALNEAADTPAISRNRSMEKVQNWRDAEMQKQAFPIKPTESIDAVIGEYGQHPESLSLRQGQNFKQSLNKELNDFYKMLDTDPAKAGQKWTMKAKQQFRDDLAQQVQEIFPEVKELNKREGALIELNKVLGKAVNRIGQRDMLSLKTIAALGHSPKLALTELIMNNPAIQSSLAVAMRSARRNPVKAGAFDKAVLGVRTAGELADPLGIRQ